MNNVFDSFKLTLFELVGYVLPEVFLELVVFVFFFPSGILGFASYLPVLLIFSYPIGQILHSVSNVLDYDIKDIGWKIYHLIKEKDNNGHGVENPESKLGKLAKKLRSYIEKHTIKPEKNETDQILRSKLGLQDMSSFDLFFMKESILAESSNIATNFEHLHYQKIFNKSIAFIFACLTFLLPLAPLLGVKSINLSKDKSLEIGGSLFLLTLCSAIIYKVFFERVKFFKSYRDKVMNSAVRMYLKKKGHNLL